jgi:hypothetical protein
MFSSFVTPTHGQVCRRGHIDLLEVLVDAGVNLQVSDDYGRTVSAPRRIVNSQLFSKTFILTLYPPFDIAQPLHDACWTAEPAFDVMDLLLKTDPRLLYMKDARGSLPFSYLHKDHWPVWKLFLDDMKDAYFPSLPEGQEQGPPKLAELPPNSLPVPDPKHALPHAMAALLSNGKMTADEIKMLLSADHEDSNTHEESDSCYSSDCSGGSDESGSGSGSGSDGADSSSYDDDDEDSD